MSPDREGAGGARRSGGGAALHGGVRSGDGSETAAEMFLLLFLVL
ncbi:hypothetical protein A2U01_0085858 [Trifolium medium]|uniref:Uncharacterized protein n=1 Tax=Trifolium medium TaxID=97028 RepID=A0A392TWF6_9FABA|nr:hypothetical protein [Trifolium medium]